jgi:hypothetical protein
MSFEDAVLDYLAKPENLPLAMEVAEYVQILRNKLHEKFWRMYSFQMKERLLASDHGETWEFIPFPLNRLKTDFEGSSIRPKQESEIKTSVLQVQIIQGNRQDQYRLVRGIRWTGAVGDFDHPTLRQLKVDLINHNLTYDQWHWVGAAGHQYRPQGVDLMVKMHNEPDEAISEVADEIWELFQDTRLQMEEINQAYAQFSKEQQATDG